MVRRTMQVSQQARNVIMFKCDSCVQSSMCLLYFVSYKRIAFHAKLPTSSTYNEYIIDCCCCGSIQVQSRAYHLPLYKEKETASGPHIFHQLLGPHVFKHSNYMQLNLNIIILYFSLVLLNRFLFNRHIQCIYNFSYLYKLFFVKNMFLKIRLRPPKLQAHHCIGHQYI